MHDAKLHTGRRYERHDKHSADRDQQSADLTANRAGLEAESDKLLAAHFADAIDLGALKRHQDRIRAGLADIERRLTSATDRLPTASSDAHASPNRSRPSSPNQSRNDLQEHPPSSDVTGSRKTLWVDLRSSFSNPRKPLGSLISRVLRGSRARRPRTRGAQIADERGPVRENSRQSQTRLSVSNRAELIAGYADGVPVRELATRFNVHRGTVREIARQAGLAARRPELPDATRQDAAQLYAGGLTLAQVAARLAVSTEAVRSAVIASGGTIRAGGRRRVGA